MQDPKGVRDTWVGVESVATLGRLRSLVGLAIEADVPGARMGELCEIEREGSAPLLAEVVGFRDHIATLLPLGRAHGLAPDDAVRPTQGELEITVGENLLGRVLDGLGQPIDEAREERALVGPLRAVRMPPPAPLSRPRIERAFETGVRAIDGLLTLGEGQRIGLFAGSGIGKTSLLAQIARQATQSEDTVFVLCLVGERGREVRELVQDALGEEGLSRGVVVCATADEPPLVRMKSALVATAIAEGFREQGKRVLLLVDSLTRFARAAREVGLAAGESPVRRGYPASVLAALPELVERAGTSAQGSITALYTVLVEGDDHIEDPIADELRGILDGHIVLRRELAARGHFPAIDVPASLSRVMHAVVSGEHLQLAAKLREHIAAYEHKRELVQLGAYVAGSDKRLDAAIARIDRIEAFLRQDGKTRCPLADSLAQLRALA